MRRAALFLCLAGCATASRPGGPRLEPVRIPGTPLRFVLAYVEGGGLAPFWIGTREVTWAEFNRFYESREEQKADGVTRPSAGREYVAASGLPSSFLEPDRPATSLQYHSAIAYCEWLSKKTGMIFRLPTEAEWDLACGDASPGQGWFRENSDDRTHPAAEREPNALGIHDMLGNVWEYCLEPDRPPEFGPVLRGGAWNTPASARRITPPSEWFEADPSRPFSVWWFRDNFSQGFRVVRVPENADAREREAYGQAVEISSLEPAGDRAVRKGASRYWVTRVRGVVRNGGGRTLEELALKVYALDPKGDPHPVDVEADQARRATYNVAYPVLRNSAHPGPQARTLRPGESRGFEVELPSTFDGPQNVRAGKFGASVLHFRFSVE